MSLHDRFWAKVDKSGECWLWTGARSSTGYGQFQVDGHRVGAHRHSYEMATGQSPKGWQVMHSCDTPLCVRPEHLSLGNHAMNAADMIRKGRHVTAFTPLVLDAARALRTAGFTWIQIAEVTGRSEGGLKGRLCSEAIPVLAQRDGISPHGTRSRYETYGCRCDPCRRANSSRSTVRRQRARRAVAAYAIDIEETS